MTDHIIKALLDAGHTVAFHRDGDLIVAEVASEGKTTTTQPCANVEAAVFELAAAMEMTIDSSGVPRMNEHPGGPQYVTITRTNGLFEVRAGDRYEDHLDFGEMLGLVARLGMAVSKTWPELLRTQEEHEAMERHYAEACGDGIV